MNNALSFTLLILFITISSCKENMDNKTSIHINYAKQKQIDNYNFQLFSLTKIDSKQVLDSLRTLADTIFADTATYIRSPKATLYVNNAAQTKNQVFENPKGTITVIAYFRENKQINVAEYYSNGQIICRFTVTDDGIRNGKYYCYYEDGSYRTTGIYRDGSAIKDSSKMFERVKK